MTQNRKRRSPLTSKEKQEILDYLEAGWSKSKIGRFLGINRNIVSGSSKKK